MKKIENILKKTLILQIIFYTLTHLTFYLSITKEGEGYQGLSGFIWLGLFFVFGIINVVTFLVYTILKQKNNGLPDPMIVVLLAINITAAALYVPLSSVISSNS